MRMRWWFDSVDDATPWRQRAFVATLYFVGLVSWIYFFGMGRVALDFHDWADITVPRLLFLQSSWQSHELPLHMARSNALHGVTERFLSIPDVITSPQSVLLTVLPINIFVIVDVLLHYSIGFASLLLLRRYFKWSPIAFVFVFLLVLFNGHVLAHYSVGHFSWGPYFLFPFVALLVFRFLDGDSSRATAAIFAATMFYMMLAGGYHQFIWILLLLTLLIPFCWRRSGWLVTVIVATGLLSAVRLLPPALELQSFRDAGFVTDVHGYPSLMHLVESLVYLRREHRVIFREIPANLILFQERFWEYNLYIGVAGAAAVVWGAIRWLRDQTSRYRELAGPLAILTMFSIGSVYRVARFSGVPLLLGERATSRMAGLVLVFLVILAATQIDRLLRTAGALKRQLAFIGLAFVVIDVAGSIRLQRLAVSSGMFAAGVLNPAAPAYPPDPTYSRTLLAGLLLTIVTAIALAVLVARERSARRRATATA